MVPQLRLPTERILPATALLAVTAVTLGNILLTIMPKTSDQVDSQDKEALSREPFTY